MKVRADGFEFEFPGALEAFVFDESDKLKSNFHGLSHAMKAVDLVVELPQHTLFIEVKDFHSPDDYNFNAAISNDEEGQRRKRVNHLRDVLVHKFRDTWLYRWSERARGTPGKQVFYLCLLSLDNGLLGTVRKELHKALPVGIAGPRWQRGLAASCEVLNIERWNKVFPSWPLNRC
ncbi:hypothetical protein NQT62_08120 [Limnobacter humi]|uniref:Uncharacterized protein n=1 Tax=Limnobacter humi TaxID=1778671 RepID=A0ABT1WJ02_9BURK|nr:hypothetical protein [Limnobacter humi]MCQ8896394.1 hypothetical protein [Limnobacter humi]